MYELVKDRLKLKKKILVVDDEQINQLMLSRILENDYEVLLASDGKQALDILIRNRGTLSLVLLDLNMPVMDGYTAAKKIRSLPDKDVSSIPIIATTANAFAEDIRHALEVGMDAHISKPISIEKVIDVIGKVCK